MLELSDTNELFREALKITFQNVIFKISECIQPLIENKEIKAELNAEDLAQFIFSAWEGAIMYMRLSRNQNALNNFKQIIFDNLLTNT